MMKKNFKKECRMYLLRSKRLIALTLGATCFYASFPVAAQYSSQECQSEINKMREIYIIILRKIPIMPPLAQLSPGIQRAINEAESSRNQGNYRDCITNMQKQISIVQGYAR
jgi:hypothetical protein